MFGSTPQVSTSAINNKSEAVVAIETTESLSTLKSIRNGLLSWFVPINMALTINDKVTGPIGEYGVFRIFMDELKNNLYIPGSSPEFIAKLMPEYLTQTLKDQMSTGQLLAFQNRIEHDLNCAYDDKIPRKIQDLYKSRALKTIMLKLGPHGLKYVQSLRAKEANGWLADAISTAQSDLPAIEIKQVEEMLKKSFSVQGTLNYVNHFSEHFEVVKVLGAGTIGIAALIKFKETSSSKEIELVVKIIRPRIVEEFIKDSKRLNQAIDILVAEKRVTAAEAASFKHFSTKKLAEELKETNPNLENAHLLEKLYEGPGVTTVRGNLELFGKSSNVVFMEKAQGIELGKYLKIIRKELLNPRLLDSERDAYLQQIAKVRKNYSSLERIHLARIMQNLPVHADLHSGNIFYDPELQMLSVLDLGAIARPVSDVAHRRLQQFLFAIYLSVGTADTQYLRFFYENHTKNPEAGHGKIEAVKVERLLVQIQLKLDDMKHKSLDQNVIDTDKASNEVMNIIMNEVLISGIEIIPSALVMLGRSNQLIVEELEALNNDLAGSRYATKVPMLERTQMGITLKLLWRLGFSNHSELWTKEVRDYFVQHSLSSENGMKQLKFEKKFIYGILGLTESEAAMADILIPSVIISSPMVLALGAKVLDKTIKTATMKLAELKLSYKFIENYKSLAEEGVPVGEFFKKINHMISNNRFFDHKSMDYHRKKIQTSLNNPLKKASSHLQHTLFQGCHRMPIYTRFAPGLVIGAGLMYGARKYYDRSR